MRNVALTMMKLAHRAAERGDAEGARLALVGLLAIAATTDTEPGQAPELQAVRKRKLAALLDVSTRHLDTLEKKFPPEAILSSGSGKRYVVSLVFASLGRAPIAVADPVVEEGRAHARRIAKLKLVSGGG